MLSIASDHQNHRAFLNNNATSINQVQYYYDIANLLIILSRTMAGKKTTKKKSATATIANNKSARHNYFVEDSFEAGLVLEGWEVLNLCPLT